MSEWWECWTWCAHKSLDILISCIDGKRGIELNSQQKYFTTGTNVKLLKRWGHEIIRTVRRWLVVSQWATRVAKLQFAPNTLQATKHTAISREWEHSKDFDTVDLSFKHLPPQEEQSSVVPRRPSFLHSAYGQPSSFYTYNTFFRDSAPQIS